MRGKPIEKLVDSIYSPLERKTFKAALSKFFEDQCPQYGELARDTLVQHLQALVEKFYPSHNFMRMGQVMWPAVDEKETAGYGKSIEKTKLMPVFVDIITDDDIKKLANSVKKKDIRKEAAVRIFMQSKEQGGVLTGVDVASMMNMSPATVYKYVREYEQEKKVLVPRRGTIHDMGRTLTHKKEICRKIIIEGKTVEETARLTNHSPEAITRYVKDYKRISSCLAKGLSPKDTAFAVKVSENLVYEYQKLIKENDIDLNSIPL